MEFSEITKKYWTKEDWENLEKTESVEDLYFISSWQTSFRAKCEHEKAKKLGIKIVYL